VNRSEAPISALMMTCFVRLAPVAVGPRLGVHLPGDQDANTLAQRLDGVLGNLLPQRHVVEAERPIGPAHAPPDPVVDRNPYGRDGLSVRMNRRFGLPVRLPDGVI
jgi:hypothetical protein